MKLPTMFNNLSGDRKNVVADLTTENNNTEAKKKEEKEEENLSKMVDFFNSEAKLSNLALS
jgi:hypothetical protein